VRKKHARHPPPHGGRRTDQRKGTRLIFMGQDRGCGNVPVKRAVLCGNAYEPGDGDGGPREGSLSCLTVSRKEQQAAWPRPHGFKHAVRRCTVQAVRCRAAARKHSTMTLVSDARTEGQMTGITPRLPGRLVHSHRPLKMFYLARHSIFQFCAGMRASIYLHNCA